MGVSDPPDGYDIEATSCEQRRMTLKVVLGAGENARLLLRADTLRAAAEVRSAAKAHLDEDERRSIAHDQIDFTVSAAVVSREQPKPMLTQMPTRERFGHCSGRRRAPMHGILIGRHYGTGAMPSSMIFGVPLLNRAHMRRRSI